MTDITIVFGIISIISIIIIQMNLRNMTGYLMDPFLGKRIPVLFSLITIDLFVHWINLAYTNVHLENKTINVIISDLSTAFMMLLTVIVLLVLSRAFLKNHWKNFAWAMTVIVCIVFATALITTIFQKFFINHSEVSVIMFVVQNSMMLIYNIVGMSLFAYLAFVFMDLGKLDRKFSGNEQTYAAGIKKPAIFSDDGLKKLFGGKFDKIKWGLIKPTKSKEG